MKVIKFLLRAFFSVLFTGVFLVCLGLPLFYSNIDSEPTKNHERADAIIVLTGSAERIPEGLRLLNEGQADKLFISGVGEHAKVSELLDSAILGWSDLIKVDISRVSLGYRATDTVGNATETKEWAQENNVETAHLVTSNYHMARAKLELRKVMPQLKIIDNPTIPINFDKHKWQEDKAVRDLIIREYFKYLYSWLGMNEK